MYDTVLQHHLILKSWESLKARSHYMLRSFHKHYQFIDKTFTCYCTNNIVSITRRGIIDISIFFIFTIPNFELD